MVDEPVLLCIVHASTMELNILEGIIHEHIQPRTNVKKQKHNFLLTTSKSNV